MRATTACIAMLIALTSACHHEEPATTDTTLPTQALITTTVAEPQRPFEKIDVCELVAVDELTKAFDRVTEIAKSNTADGRCRLTMTYSDAAVHQYTLWFIAPESFRAGGGKGLAALVIPSPQLATIVGAEPLPRSEVTKRVWDYIKSNGLQDRENKRMINADQKLGVVFDGRKQVSMFEMTALVNKHVSLAAEAEEQVDGLGDAAYVVPATRDADWRVRVLKRDKFQLNVLGTTRGGVLKVADYIVRKLQL